MVDDLGHPIPDEILEMWEKDDDCIMKLWLMTIAFYLVVILICTCI